MPWKGLFASEKGCECTIQNIWGQPVVKRENHLLSLICLVNQLYYDKATHRMLRGSRRRVPSGIWGSGRHHGGASAQLRRALEFLTEWSVKAPLLFLYLVSWGPSTWELHPSFSACTFTTPGGQGEGCSPNHTTHCSFIGSTRPTALSFFSNSFYWLPAMSWKQGS